VSKGRGPATTGSRYADNRPRIYLRPADKGAVTWSLSPNGLGTPTPSISAAIINALVAVDHAPAVIFWEPQP